MPLCLGTVRYCKIQYDRDVRLRSGNDLENVHRNIALQTFHTGLHSWKNVDAQVKARGHTVGLCGYQLTLVN